MKPTPQDIDAICDLVHGLCGIYLDNSKDYLIESRLARLIQQHSFPNYSALAREAGIKPQLRRDVIDAITTNETLWFRDSSPFEALRHKIIPELIDVKAGSLYEKRFRIWSAACSTGQEAYSIAMAFADILPDFDSWDIQIVGTDISPTAVERAQRGIYSDLEVSRGLSPFHQNNFFKKQGENWQVVDRIRSACRFEVGNLLDPFEKKRGFDIVFCRNVGIYFQPEDRQRLFQTTKEALVQGGWLFAGSGESLIDLGDNWRPHQHCGSVCYQPNGCNGVAKLTRV